MRRTTLRTTGMATLAAFSLLCLAPRGALADDVPGEIQPPRPPVSPQPPAAQPQRPPAYPAYPPGYQNPPPYPPAYPQQPQQQPGYPYPTYPTVPLLGPMKMKLVEQPRYGMAIAGASVFGGVWLTTSLVAYSSNNNAAIVPIIGPLFYLNGRDDGGTRFNNVGLTIVSLAQATGVILFIAGMVTKDKVWVRDTEVSVVPTTFSGGGGGLVAAGRF